MGDPVLSGGGGLGRDVSHLPGQQRPDDLDAPIGPHLYPHAAAAGLCPLLQDLQRLRGRSGLRCRHAPAGVVRGAAARARAHYPIPRMQDGKWRLHPALPDQDHLHAVRRGVHLVFLLCGVSSLQQRPHS